MSNDGRQVDLFGKDIEDSRPSPKKPPALKRLGIFHSLAIQTTGEGLMVRDSRDELLAQGTRGLVVNITHDELERSAQALASRATDERDVAGALAFLQNITLQSFGMDTIEEYIRNGGDYKTLARMSGLSGRAVRRLAKFEGLKVGLLDLLARGRLAPGVAYSLAKKPDAIQAEALALALKRPTEKRALTGRDVDGLTRTGYKRVVNGLALAIPMVEREPQPMESAQAEAHELLDSRGIPRLQNGQPITLAERIKLLIARLEA